MNVCKFRTRSPLQKCKLCWIEPASILLGTNHWKYLIWLNRHSIWVKWPNLLVLIQVMVRRWEVRPCWLTGIPFNWLLSVSDGILKSILLPTFLMNLFGESSSVCACVYIQGIIFFVAYSLFSWWHQITEWQYLKSWWKPLSPSIRCWSLPYFDAFLLELNYN